MKIIYLILAISLSSYSFGNEDSDTFFYIDSDVLIISKNLLTSEFIGNAYARNGPNHFWGDRILVNHGNDKKIKLITIIGNVKIKQINEEALGDKAVYTLESEKIKINGNVSVIKDNNIIKGNELIVDLINSTSIITGNENKQVSAKVINRK